MSELRWNPLLGEWLVTATHRQNRTFLPPADFCPLCPTRNPEFPTEIPAEDYDIVVFENRFPSLSSRPPEPAIEPSGMFAVQPAIGVCEVVVYTPVHTATLAGESVQKIDKLVSVWIDRTEALGALEFVDYVFIFENKGEQIGVTLHHPHGQIYAYPFIPPVLEREVAQFRAHKEQTGSCLLCDVIEKEHEDKQRIVAENSSFIATVPFYARYPYEIHIMSRRHFGLLTEMTLTERRELALTFPYIMSIHQAPTDGADHSDFHFHIEFYPPLRTATKLKFLAGSEAGAGLYINDTLAESKAAEIRALVTPIELTAEGELP
jgi:UDPglucose--hexose-1-phosphate uridylyltransferase